MLPSPRIISSAACCAPEFSPSLGRMGFRSSFLWGWRFLFWFAGWGGWFPSLMTFYCDLLVLLSLDLLLLFKSKLHWVVKLCVCFAFELSFMCCLRCGGLWHEWLFSIQSNYLAQLFFFGNIRHWRHNFFVELFLFFLQCCLLLPLEPLLSRLEISLIEKTHYYNRNSAWPIVIISNLTLKHITPFSRDELIYIRMKLS